ncbi:MAG TPA: TonB-dependent receptor [Allosphingosinicella sp.]|nr:TonB-dependent receptor [Allosphingosinicella sp.]
MRKTFCLALILLAAPLPSAAQDMNSSEVIVTANRRQSSDYERMPLIGLRRTADFAVQYVSVAGDTREMNPRREEIFAMVRGAIALAGARGVELATGQLVVEPLTLANYRDLPLLGDGRPDSERVSFLIKTSLKGSDGKAALDRIEAFIKAVPTVGRAQMQKGGDLTLSVVGPDQYRGQIIDLVSADARATAARLGPDYAVSASGLDRPVEWARATLTDVFLYVPYNYTILPKQ